MTTRQTPAVRGLRKRAGLIGEMHGQRHLGEIGAADLRGVLGNHGLRACLRQAYAAASADIGGRKALKVALASARDRARACARQAGGDYTRVLKAAENAVRDILVPPAPPTGETATPASQARGAPRAVQAATSRNAPPSRR